MALYMGLLVYYAVAERTSYVILSAVATAGSVMVQLFPRARRIPNPPLQGRLLGASRERMVLLILGGLFNRMAPALWVIAIVATLTVVHRILYTWQETKAVGGRCRGSGSRCNRGRDGECRIRIVRLRGG